MGLSVAYEYYSVSSMTDSQISPDGDREIHGSSLWDNLPGGGEAYCSTLHNWRQAEICARCNLKETCNYKIAK